jgi:hypothetical protein
VTRRGRLAAAGALIATAFLCTVSIADARERAAVGPAAAQLRAAVFDAAALDSCFQGVQDDLSFDGAELSPRSVDAARARLVTCDVEALRSQLARVRLGAEAPLVDPRTRRVRRELDAARAALDRLVLDAEATRSAMVVDLDRRALEATAAVGYRASAASYQRAARHVDRAFAFLEPRPTPVDEALNAVGSDADVS